MTLEGEDLDLFGRSLRAATETKRGAELDAALVDLGWPDALAVDPRASVSLLFELQGEANATSTALEWALLDVLGLELDAGTRLIVPSIGRWAAPGHIDGDDLTVQGLVAGGLGDADTVVVVADTGSEEVAVALPAAELDRRPVHGVDPAMELVEVSGAIRIGAECSPLAADWSAAISVGRRCAAHELVGASRTMLARACDHALERVQFGVPIASFQAVRHRLAETLVAIETASALLDAAWLDGTDLTATMAKVAAGREARVAAKHCQQVLAGIGFTTEHDLHRYVRRVFVLDGLFGTSKGLMKTVGDELVASRRLPPLLPL